LAAACKLSFITTVQAQSLTSGQKKILMKGHIAGGSFMGGKFNAQMDKRIGAVAYVHAVEPVCSIAF